MSFFSDREILYKKIKDQMLLRCVDTYEAKRILEKVHEGAYGSHTNGRMTGKQMMKAWFIGPPWKMFVLGMFRSAINVRFM